MMPEPRELPAVDEPPSSGIYVDHDEHELTDDEAAEGNAESEGTDDE